MRRARRPPLVFAQPCRSSRPSLTESLGAISVPLQGGVPNAGPVAVTLMRVAASPMVADVEGGLAMPLLEAMLTQRAIRRLRPDPLDDAIVLRCIEIALKAPTSSNGQNWEWIIVKDQAVKEKLAAQYRQVWAIYGRAMRRRGRGGDSPARTLDPVDWPVTHLPERPVLGAACPPGGSVPLPPPPPPRPPPPPP